MEDGGVVEVSAAVASTAEGRTGLEGPFSETPAVRTRVQQSGRRRAVSAGAQTWQVAAETTHWRADAGAGETTRRTADARRGAVVAATAVETSWRHSFNRAPGIRLTVRAQAALPMQFPSAENLFPFNKEEG